MQTWVCIYPGDGCGGGGGGFLEVYGSADSGDCWFTFQCTLERRTEKRHINKDKLSVYRPEGINTEALCQYLQPCGSPFPTTGVSGSKRSKHLNESPLLSSQGVREEVAPFTHSSTSCRDKSPKKRESMWGDKASSLSFSLCPLLSFGLFLELCGVIFGSSLLQWWQIPKEIISSKRTQENNTAF